MLELLVHPLTVRTFIERHWPSNVFTGSGPVERFDALRNLPELGSVTALAQASVPGQAQAWFGHTAVRIESDQAPQLLSCGASIYFRGLEVGIPALHPFMAALERDLALAPGSVVCDGFIGQPGSSVLPHIDNDVGFNIQLTGRKRWRLAEDERFSFPSSGVSEGQPVAPELQRDGFEGEPVMPDPDRIYDVGPGAVTFVHPSAWHATEVLPGEPAFSLVFAVSVRPWHWQVTQALSRTLQQLPDWRRPAYELHSPDPEIRARGEQMLNELLADLPNIAARMPASEVSQTDSTPYLEATRHFLPAAELKITRSTDGRLGVIVSEQNTLRLSPGLAAATAALLSQVNGFTGRQAIRLAHPLSTRRTSTLVRWLVDRKALQRIRAEP